MHDLSPTQFFLDTQKQSRWTLDRTAVEEGTSTFPTAEREALLWLDDYARANNLGLAGVGAMLSKPNGNSYSKDTVYQVLTGRETSIANFVGAVQVFRKSIRNVITAPYEFPFVKSSVAKAIWAYIELTRRWHKIGLVIAESQLGKTRSIREYIKANPELDILYVQLTTGGNKSRVVLAMCDERGVSDKYNTAQREKRLARTLTSKTLIIVDEIQQCASRERSGGRTTAERVDTIEYLRWLHDTVHCPMLLTGTTEALNMLEGSGLGHDSKNIFIQTLKRSLDPYVIKNSYSPHDLNTFADKVELKPAQGTALRLQDDTVKTRGLEVWLTYLLAGAELAAQQNRKTTWDDVLAGYKTFTGKEAK